jgi:hypothetical protein
MHIPTVSLIKRHVSKMPEGRLFHTSELLGYGPRGTVDQNLRRLWVKGFIIKVARALWVKAVGFQPARTPVPPVLEIARLKAGAFKKEITSVVKQVASGTFEFMSAGRNSSFGSCHGRVYLRQRSMRKISLGQGVVGTTLLEMWNAGPRMFAKYLPVLAKFGRQEREELRKLISTLPQWLRGHLSLPMHSGP